MMKKKYVKPRIVFEDFTLNTSISAGCEMETPLPSYEESCGYPIKGAVIFVENTQCTNKQQDGAYNGVCYHVPSDENNLFNS